MMGYSRGLLSIRCFGALVFGCLDIDFLGNFGNFGLLCIVVINMQLFFSKYFSQFRICLHTQETVFTVEILSNFSYLSDLYKGNM